MTNTLFSEKFVIDLNKHSCSCNFWGLVGIPSRHALAAINDKEDDVIKYVNKCYGVEAYALCYGHGISPINGVDMWPPNEFG